MKKKLQLHRTTIAHLTGPELARLVGGAGGLTGEAGMQSIKVDTRVEPCQWASEADVCFAEIRTLP